MKDTFCLFIFLLTLISCANEKSILTKEQKKIEISKIRTQMAIEFMKNNDFRNAVTSINESIALNPKDYIAWNAKALIYQSLKVLEESEKSYKKALLLNPKSSETLNNYGWFLCSIKNNTLDSIKYFDKALEDPTYPTPYLALMNKGICEGKLKEFSHAENDIIRANRISPYWFKEPIKELARIKYNQSEFIISYNLFNNYYKSVNNLNADTLLLGWKIAKSLNKKKDILKYENLIRKNFPNSEELKQILILDR